jgi:hypothetical protein
MTKAFVQIKLDPEVINVLDEQDVEGFASNHLILAIAHLNASGVHTIGKHEYMIITRIIRDINSLYNVINN